MRLLLINDGGIFGGGAESRIRLLLEEFTRRDALEEIHVIHAPDALSPKMDGVVFHSCEGYWPVYKLTRYIVKKYNIDIVQAHNMLSLSPMGVYAAKRLRIPVVWFAHDYWPLCAYRTFVKFKGAEEPVVCDWTVSQACSKCIGIRGDIHLQIHRKIINTVNAGITPGRFVKDLYERNEVLRGRWQVVIPWIDVDRFGTIEKPPRGNDILFVGPLTPHKGAVVAVKALKYIIKEIPDARLKFIGPGQEEGNVFRKTIENMAHTNGVLRNITFLGYKGWDELKFEYATAKIYICSPIWPELFGLNWAEAMASGCVVIASNVGSIPEFITDERGKCVSVGDYKSFAEWTIKFLKDKEYAERLSEAGRKYALNTFCAKRAATEITDLYRNLIETKSLRT